MTEDLRLCCLLILSHIRRLEDAASAKRRVFSKFTLPKFVIISEFLAIAVFIRHQKTALTSLYPDPVWRDVEDFRSALLHPVHISPDKWLALVQEDLPALEAAVTALLADLEDAHTSK